MPRTSPSALTISVTTSPQPPCRFTSRRNAESVMPAIGATAKGDGRFTWPMRIILNASCIALAAAAHLHGADLLSVVANGAASESDGAGLGQGAAFRRIRRPLDPAWPRPAWR